MGSVRLISALDGSLGDPPRHTQMRSSFGLFAIIFVLSAATMAVASEPTVFKQISWNPQQIETGSPCLFRVEMEDPLSALNGTWMAHSIRFFTASEPHVWYGLAGVDVEVRPGTYELELSATLPNGNVIHTTRTLLVRSGKYKTVTLRVPDRFVEPDAETLRRIESEKEIKKNAFSHQTAGPEWSGSFRPPLQSTVTEVFGTRRTFNGKLASIHRGLDYRAATGSPVFATNSGEVVLARDLFYEGNCVIIDHGQQFMTLYMHLSKLQVTEGQRVEKGQQLGLSGGTGRATGPHLHLAVRWQGAYLDPAQLLALPLPRIP